MRPTRITRRVLRRFAENAEANAADESNVNDSAVAETSSAEVDADLCWKDEVLAGKGVGEVRHEEVL